MTLAFINVLIKAMLVTHYPVQPTPLCKNLHHFLYTLLIILMQKTGIWYLCIWPFEFFKYHDNVNRALERGV